jgi:hypothetical protein
MCSVVYVWPLFPSSYDVVLVTIVVINSIDAKIVVVVAYFIDFVWAKHMLYLLSCCDFL